MPGGKQTGFNDPRDTLGGLLENQPTSYDAQFEFRARRRIIDEMLSNLRPAGAQSNYIAGATGAY